MRAGLPIVASDVNGIPEAVIHGKNGFLVARGDVNGFARALETLLASAALRYQMGRDSRRIFEQCFIAEHMLRKTFSVYRQAIHEPRSDYGSSVSGTLENA